MAIIASSYRFHLSLVIYSFVISGPQRGFRQKGALVVSFFRAIFNAGERFVSVFAR